VPYIERGHDGMQLLKNFEKTAVDEATVGGIKQSMAEFGTSSVGHAGAFGVQWTGAEIDIDYESVREGFDSIARIAYMDREGVDAAALYPTMGLLLGGFRDPELAAAVYRAYNRWLADFCKPYRNRLYGAAMIPLQDRDLAIKELTFAMEDLELPLIVLRPNPYAGRVLHDPYFMPFWERVESYGAAVAIHSGSADDMPTVAMDRFGSKMTTRHLVSHTLEIMLAMASIVYGGPASLHPNLRFAFFEGGGGWVPGWIDRMDRHFDKAYADVTLDRRPSDIFRQQCWVCFDPAEGSLAWAADYLGPDRVLWATDFPHPDGVPNGADLIRENAGLSKEAKELILGANASQFYRVAT
jgi:predicted TIM-barrel fold metal-dependent hydrolase